VDVDAVVRAAVPECEGGPSGGGLSSHTLKDTMCWRKAYFAHVLGLRLAKEKRHFAFGKLYHYCLEAHYKTAGQKTFVPCEAVRHAGDAEMAEQVTNLVRVQLNKHGAEEAQTWAPLAVENQLVYWMEPAKINGKTYYIPLTCRLDMLIAIVRQGQEYPKQGEPYAHGVTHVDWKTASSATKDLTDAYALDPQFLHNALIHMRGQASAQFGPLASVLIHIAVKHARPDPERSMIRFEVPHPVSAIEEYYHTEARPQAICLTEMLLTASGDMTRWPKDHRVCSQKYMCDYVSICNGSTMSSRSGLLRSGCFFHLPRRSSRRQQQLRRLQIQRSRRLPRSDRWLPRTRSSSSSRPTSTSAECASP
jgi:hypothetical protein